MSKLILHFEQSTPWMVPVMGDRFGWVKWCNPSGGNPFPRARTIGRLDDYRGKSDLWKKGAAGADEWYAWARPQMLACRWVYVWEGPNEPVAETPEAQLALVAFWLRLVELAHKDGFKMAAGSFSTGCPRLPDFDADGNEVLRRLAPLFRAADYWAVHEYGYQSMPGSSTWQALRHRHLHACLRAIGVESKPILITETGIEPGGWKKWCSSPDTYRAQLAWYSEQLDQDDGQAGRPLVECAAVFTSGHTRTWENHAFEEGDASWLSAYVASHPSPKPAPVTPPPYAPEKVAAPGVTYQDWYGSPNCCERAGCKVRRVVVHSTDKAPGVGVGVCKSWFASSASGVSANDIIAEDGMVIRVVGYDRAAWHCGGSVIPGLAGGSVSVGPYAVDRDNLETIGIELDHPYTPGAPWPEAQLRAAAAHIKALAAQYGLTRADILRHGDIDPRKSDPRDLAGAQWQAFLDRIWPPAPPAPQPGNLPEGEASKDAFQLFAKAIWWIEEATRALEGLQYQRAHEILVSEVKLIRRIRDAVNDLLNRS